MNRGATARLSKLKGRYNPFLAARRQLLAQWEGGGDDSICSRYSLAHRHPTVPPPRSSAAGAADVTPKNYATDVLGVPRFCGLRQPGALYSLIAGDVPCQCDEFCEQFGDCCPDYRRPVGVMEKPPLTCLSTQYPDTPYRGIGYYVVATCASFFVNEAMIAQCRVPDAEKQRPLMYHTPVRVAGVVYRNAYCAACNFMNNVALDQFWPHQSLVGSRGACREEIENAKRHYFNESLMPERQKGCYPYGFAEPLGDDNPLEGASRMGKMCLYDPDVGDLAFMQFGELESWRGKRSVGAGTPDAPETWARGLTGWADDRMNWTDERTLETDGRIWLDGGGPGSVDRATNLTGKRAPRMRRQSSTGTRPLKNRPTHVLMYYNHLEAVRMGCFYTQCHSQILPYITADLRPLARLFSNESDSQRFLPNFVDVLANLLVELPTASGHVWDLFRQVDDDDDDDDVGSVGAGLGHGGMAFLAYLAATALAIVVAAMAF